MKNWSGILLSFFFAVSFVACDNNDEVPAPPAGTSALGTCYILNSGDPKSNNSSLTMYNGTTGEVVQNYFELQNGRKLGNTANDIIAYGSKLYIAVALEGTIEVASADAKSLAQIECGAQPRYLASHGGKVYATYYNGHVARIDTATLEVEAIVPVGRNPEQLAVYGNMLYVANSGGMDYNTPLGYDRTVSVIDLESFQEVKKIEVVQNPAVVVPAVGGVFVASYGNYADVPSTLQLVSPEGNAEVVAQCANMTEICFCKGTLYGFFSQYDADWNPTVTFMSYTPSTGATDSPWIKGGAFPAAYKMCTLGDYVCVTSSDYINDGDIYIYDTDGMPVSKVAVGLNPVKAVEVE